MTATDSPTRLPFKNWRRTIAGFMAMLIGCATLAVAGAGTAHADTTLLHTGQVFASVGNSDVDVFDAGSGNLITTLNDGTGETYTAGGVFDTKGDFYVTDDLNGDISEYDDQGNLLPLFASGLSNPLSLVFDNSGNLYVGQQTTPYVAEFDPNGNRLADIGPMDTELYGVDWIDLASDQCTLYYTTEGTDILRYNKCTNQQLPNFNTTPFDPTQSAFQLRILPDGGVLVADSDAVLRLDASGNVIQTYSCNDLPGCAGGLFALNLDPDGTSFWTGDNNSGLIWQVDMATGQVLQTINANTALLYGLTIDGQVTAATSPSGGSTDVPTTLTVNPATSDYNVATTVSGVLTNSNTSAPIAGEPVTFALNGSETCTGTTDSTGTASCSITPSEAQGTYPLTGSFAGDTTQTPNLLASNGSNNFVVTPDPTAITYTGTTATTNGQPAILSGNLTSFGNPLPGKTVLLTLGSGSSVQSCSGTTDSSGSATCTIASVNQTVGTVPVTSSFAGDDYYVASTDSSTASVDTDTKLEVNPATSDYNVATTVSGVLTNLNTSAAITGEPVTFTLNGAETCSGITDATGTASCSITPGEAKGTYPLTGTFGGDTAASPVLLSSNGSNTFVVTPDPTAITYTGDTTATNGSSATLSGVLTAFGNVIPDKTVQLTLGTGSAAQSCSATTDASGSASCSIASVNQTPGSVPVTASFAGDSYYLASTVSSSVTVSPPPPVPTTLTVNSATGDYNVATTVSGYLTNANTEAPISGEPVTLTLNDNESCTAITDSSGLASCSLTPGEAEGTYPLTGSFAGDTSVSPVLLSSTGANTFVVTPDPTAITYTGATTATIDQPATLSGVLTAFGNPLPDKSVTLTLGSGGSAQSCSATTDVTGAASCSIASVSQSAGSVPVTASFAGDTYYSPSSVIASVAVSLPPAVPTILTVNGGTGDYNVATTVSGVLTNANTLTPIAGEPVTLTLNGAETCTATTDTTGTASCSITPGEAKGTYPLTGTFAGDSTLIPALLASTGSNTFVVTPDPTAITYTGDTTATNGSSATLSGVLTAFGNVIPDKTVQLTLGTGSAAQSCSATTDASGSASCSIASVNQTPGSVPVTASFAGDSYYLASTVSSSVTVSPPPPVPTTLTVNSATGDYNVATTVSGYLTNANTEAPISGEPVTLTLNDNESCTAITDSSGLASCSLTPGEAEGTYPLTGSFAGDTSVSPVLLSSTGANTFVVTPDPTAITYTGATTATIDQPATLSGVLTAFGNPLPDKSVTLTLGSGGSAQSCSATTDVTGAASCSIASVSQSAGSVPVTASFAGDTYYSPSSVIASVAVSLPPAVPTILTVNGGTGDYNVATTVSGVLTNANTLTPIAGEPVTLTLNGAETCTATTDTTGTASCSITPGEAKGTYPLTGTFAGDSTLIPALLASTGSNTFVVTPDPTAITYTGDTTATNGSSATLSGVLTAFGNVIPDKTVQLTLGTGSAAQSCSATTDASGSASCSIASVNQTPGSVPVTASFAGDSYYLASTVSSSVTVSPPPPVPTTLTVNSATGDYNVATTVSGYLTNANTEAPISGEPVTLTLNDNESCTAITDSSGLASCSLTPGEAEGTYPLTGSFAGDTSVSPVLLSSTGANTFVVTPDPTAITYTGATTATIDQPATLSGVLTAFGNPLPDKSVTLTLGSGGSAQSCSATTDVTGAASCSIASVSQSAGSVPVTASFAGDTYYSPSSVIASVAVSLPPAVPTILTVNGGTGDYNVATTVSGVLTNANTLTPIAGEPVTLTLNGAETCTATTDTTGTASCSITPGEAKGTYPLTGTFAGDSTLIPALLASTGSNTFVVTPDPTAITYTGDTTATNGSSATLSGVLTAFGNVIPDKTVQLTLGTGSAAQSCSATTDASGSASCSIASVNQTPGSVPVTASFAGDSYYLASTVSSSVTVSPPPPVPTTLTVNSATGDYNVATTVSGYLTNANTEAPISGEPVTLTLNDNESCIAITDSTGTATCTVTPGEAKGSYPLTGSFAGDTSVSPVLLSSTGANTFVVTPDPTVTVYTGAVTTNVGQPLTLSGVLTAFGIPLQGKVITLTLGTGGSAQSCTGTTDATGAASCAIASVNQTVGPVPVTASFAGDTYYQASNDASSVAVGAPLPIPTTLTVLPGTGEYSFATSVSGVLTNSNTSAPIAGEPVTLSLNGTESCTGITDSTGTATCTVTPGEAKGTYPLNGTFAGDSTRVPGLQASTGASTFVVTPDPTAIVYTGTTSVVNGQPATLSGTLTTYGNPLPGKTVTLTLGSGSSAQSCTGTTDATGSASCGVTPVNQSVSSVQVTVSFAGDNYYLSSSAAVTVGVGTPTTLKVNAATGDYNVATAVSGVLTNSVTAAPIAGEPVTLTLNGSENCTAITDSTGTATCSVTPGEAKGTYPLTGSFGGDTTASPVLLSSTGSNNFVVTPDPTAIVYTGATTATNGSSATLSGTLTVFGNPLAGKSVTLTLGTGGTAQSCTAITSASGAVSCAITSVSQTVGPVPVTAAFGGDNYYAASNVAASLTVSAPPAPTTLKVNPGTSEYGVATTVSGVLTNTATSAAIANEPVTLTLNGSENCTAITNSTGTATCSVTPGEAKGSYPLIGTFGGDATQSPDLLASTGSNTFVVTPDPTAIIYTGATTANNGSPITLSGTLSTNGTPLPGKTVTLTLGSGGTAQSCSGATNAAGSASCAIASVSQTVGSVPVTAAFAGDNYYLASSVTASVTVSPPPPIPTTLTVNPATGEYSVATTVSGTLTVTATSAPVAGEPVTFKLNAAESCSATTNASGIASCAVTPGESPATYPLTGTFGGDTSVNPNLLSSSGSSTFVVTPVPTAITYTGATTATNGSSATLSGTLTALGSPLTGKTVTLTLGTGGTAQACTATTSATGGASCAISSVNQSVGPVPVTAAFAGTAYYLASSASSTVTVSAPPPIPTTLVVNPATGEYGVATVVSGTLTNTATSVAIANEPVTFKLNATESCTGTTNSGGTASCTITPGEAKGSYPLTATFGGDTTVSPVLLASNGSNTFVVTPDPTVTVYTGATTATNGSSVTLSATLTAFGNPLSGQTVTLTLGTGGTAQSCTGTTNAAGSASCAITSVSQTAGSVPVTAAYAGNNYYLASSATASVTVSPPPPVPTTLTVNPATGEYNVATTVSGALTVTATGAPAAGEPVTFKLNATQSCSATTTSTGAASCSITPGETPASYPLTAAFAGDTTKSPNLLSSSGSSTFVVTPDPTVIVYNGATTATNGSSATLSGTLTLFGNPLASETVTLTLGSGGTAQSCTATTSATGTASCAISSVNQTVGSVPVTAAFAGTAYYLASSASSTVTVSAPPPIPTTLKVNSATSEYNVATTVSAVLTVTATSAPIAGEPVALTLNGTETCTATTTSTGTASCSITPGEPKGTYPLVGTFAGDTTKVPALSASTGSNNFVVTPDPTAIVYTGPTTANNDSPVTLSGTLTTNGTPLPGETVTLTLGSGSSAQSCTGTTGASGSASCVIASVNQSMVGCSVPVSASFAGNTYYLASSATSSVKIGAPLPVPTTLTVNSASGEYNVATTVSAVLTNTTTSAPIAGEPVTLKLDATQSCSATTNSSGIASCSVTPGESPATYPLTGTFGGDTSVNPNLLSSSGSSTFVVTPDPTAIDYTGATTANNGSPATLSGTLTTNGVALASETVTLTLGSGSTAQSCTATTSSTGAASCAISSVSQTVGSVPVTAAFAGTAYYLASSASATVTVSAPAPIPTTLKVNSATSEYNVATTVSGVLTVTATSAPISGETVTFKLNSTESCTGTTNSTGTASCSITPGEAQGTYPLAGSFAGDSTKSPALLASTGSNNFVVTPDPTAMVYTGATTATNGSPATLSGTLTTNGTPLPGETVTLTLGSGSTAQSCTGTTNSSGSASCVIASVSQSASGCTVPVTASFAGNTYYLASSASSSVKVSAAAPIPTKVTVSSATSQFGVATTVSAVLTNATTSAPIVGETVTLKLDGNESCSATTTSTGTASCTITPGEAPGSYPLVGTFAGDTSVYPNLEASSGSNTYVVTQAPTAIVYNGATTAVSGEPATLAATLTTNGTPLASQTVTLTLGSGSKIQTCTATTSSTGAASCAIASVNQSNGSVPVTATFAGTVYYLSSTNSSTLVVGVATKLKVNAATGEYGQPATVSALLTNLYTSAAIVGESVTLVLDGNETCTGITNSTGTISCTVTPSEPAGSYPLVGTFAGDTSKSPVLFASTGSNTFVVTLAPTVLTYTGATAIVNGQPATLSGVLTTNGNPLPNKVVTLTLGSGSSAQSCTGTTNATGSASCVIASVNQTATMCMGSVPVTAVFAGDAYYEAASASADVTLASAPSTGAFVIGDVSAGSPTIGNSADFWGAQWAKDNSFSGTNNAPSSMKGYADYTGAYTCGSTWTSNTGNSSDPPSSIPGEMEVIVSSHVTQSGSTESGDIEHIVVVETNSGYSSNPGHEGTGTIVGTIC